MESSELDELVHRITRQVSEQIDREESVNCCKVMKANFSEDEAAHFAKGLKISPESFKEQYLETDVGTYAVRSLPCPFLKDNQCINKD